MFEMIKPVNGLSLIMSYGCNLDCQYCRIAQGRHDNINSANLQQKTIQALSDGTFLNNIQKGLYRIKQSPHQIDTISLWGQEPTLTLHLLTEHIQDWLTVFPNWSSCSFSTNMVAYPERIYDFCCALDQHLNHPFYIDIQLSYDGEYSTSQLRGAEGNVIFKNAEILIKKLNNYHFQNLTASFHFHAVLSLDLMQKLQDPNEMFQYEKSLIEWTNYFASLNYNNSIIVEPEMDIGLENPVDASCFDGINLANCCYLSDRVLSSLLPKGEDRKVYYSLGERVRLSPFHMLDAIRGSIEEFGYQNFDELLNRITDDTIARKEFFKRVNPALWCGNGVGELKIRYDGTLVNCQNHMYDLDLSEFTPEFFKTKTLINYEKQNLVKHHYFINLLTDSNEQIIKYFDLFNTMKFESLEFIFRNTLTLLSALWQCQQIDPSYEDIRKRVKHSILLAVIGCCSYNNQITTASLYVRHTGYLRMYCNGFLEQCLNAYNNMMGKEVF
ncbi:MAG: hypothetical protein K5765_04265 [Clostridia bacterium]|nr:hypothetical protein [Clostridia bacterium]